MRVKDIELETCEILVRDGKGAKDRMTMLPSTLVDSLRAHLVLVREMHAQDLAAGGPGVYLPHTRVLNRGGGLSPLNFAKL